MELNCGEYKELTPCRKAGCVWSRKDRICLTQQEYDQRRKEYMKQYLRQYKQNPEYKEKQRVYDRERRSTPTFRERRRAMVRDTPPEVKEQQLLQRREQARRRNQDPVYRERRLEQQRQYYQRRMSDPLYREQERERVRLYSQQPEVVERRRTRRLSSPGRLGLGAEVVLSPSRQNGQGLFEVVPAVEFPDDVYDALPRVSPIRRRSRSPLNWNENK